MSRISSTSSQFESRGSWQPILETKDSHEVMPIIRAIYDNYIDSQLNSPPYLGTPGRLAEALAAALFFDYVSRSFPTEFDRKICEVYLDHAIDITSNSTITPALYGGYVGTAWVVQHLAERLNGTAENEMSDIENGLLDVDKALLDFLATSPWNHSYDLIGGLVGFGVYGRKRIQRESGRSIVEIVVEQLVELAEPHDVGLAWFTPPSLVPPSQIDIAPNGYFNLGLAHGIPGVICFLADAMDCGIATKQATRLLDGALNWLLVQRNPAGSNSLFPSFVIPNSLPTASRLAWCYGDVGIAIALLRAARLAQRRDWESQAIAIGLSASRRTDVISAGVVDAPLCHGSSGLAHIFNRLWQATAYRPFETATRYWINDTVRRYRSFGDVRGLMSIHLGQSELGAGILTGYCGVGLALASSISKIAPDWDGLMLLDVPFSR
jgi:lantibiotic biosynthesis protein